MKENEGKWRIRQIEGKLKLVEGQVNMVEGQVNMDQNILYTPAHGSSQSERLRDIPFEVSPVSDSITLQN